MIGYLIAAVMVLGLFVGASWYIAVLQDRVDKADAERLAATQHGLERDGRYRVLSKQLLNAQAEIQVYRDEVLGALARRDDLVEKLTVSPPTPDSSPPDLPLTDRDPTEAMEDSTDWTDGLTFGSLGPTMEFGAPAPGMPTAEDMQRGGA